MLSVTSIESCVVCHEYGILLSMASIEILFVRGEYRNVVLCGKGSDLMVCVLRLRSCVTC